VPTSRAGCLHFGANSKITSMVNQQLSPSSIPVRVQQGQCWNNTLQLHHRILDFTTVWGGIFSRQA
jgi:spore coat protein U-like protein